MKGLSTDAVHAAAEGGHHDIVKLMLYKGYRYLDPPAILHADCDWGLRSLLTEHSRGRQDTGRLRDSLPSDGKQARRSNEPCYEDILNMKGYSLCDGRLAGGELRHADYIRDRDEWPQYFLETSTVAGYYSYVELLLGRKLAIGISDDEVLDSPKAVAAYGHLGTFKFIFGSLPSPAPSDEFISILGLAATRGQMSIVASGSEHLDSGAWTGQALSNLASLIACTTDARLAEKLHAMLLARTGLKDLTAILEVEFVRAATHGNEHILLVMITERTQLSLSRDTPKKAFLAACAEDHGLLHLLFCGRRVGTPQPHWQWIA